MKERWNGISGTGLRSREKSRRACGKQKRQQHEEEHELWQ
jgi:hypothetical protein